MKYFKQFIAGANIIVVLPYYIAVNNLGENKNYDYYRYSLVAPFWFGLFNILSFIIANKYNLTNFQRFTLISIISSVSVMCISTYFQTYTKTKKEWIEYYIKIFIKYMLVWHLLVRNVEKLI